MHIEINDKTSLREVQEIFSTFYPYLKLEFYDKPHKKYEASELKNHIDPDVHLGDLEKTPVSGVLEILPLTRVAHLENEFQRRFGLSVQVLRKEKTGWEQTTGADDFSLKDLNELGRSSSDEFIIEDYEEGFEDTDEKPDKLY